MADKESANVRGLEMVPADKNKLSTTLSANERQNKRRFSRL